MFLSLVSTHHWRISENSHIHLPTQMIVCEYIFCLSLPASLLSRQLLLRDNTTLKKNQRQDTRHTNQHYSQKNSLLGVLPSFQGLSRSPYLQKGDCLRNLP